MLRFFKDPPQASPRSPRLLAQTVTLCQLCDRSSIKWKCVQCAELFCDDCKKIHKRSKATRNHQVVSVRDINEEILENSALNLDCPHHNFVCSMFCETCNECTCANCVTDNHNGHTFQDLKTLLDKKKREAKTALNELDTVYIPLLESIPPNSRDSDVDISHTKSELQKRASSLKQAVDRALDHHMGELSRFAQDRGEKYASIRSTSGDQLRELRDKRELLRKMSTPTNTNEVITLITSSNLYINGPTVNALPNHGRVQFHPGQLSVDDIHHEFGSLSLVEGIVDSNVPINNPTDQEIMCLPDIPEGDQIVRTFQLTKSQDLKPLHTSLSSVTSICVAPNGTLWVGCASSRRLELIVERNCAIEIPPVMTNVVGFCLSMCGDLFVTDIDHCKVRKREHPSGKLSLVKEFKPLQPVSIHVSNVLGQESIYVGLIDCNSRKSSEDYEDIIGTVVKMSSKGEIKTTIGNGSPTELRIPNRLTISKFSKCLLIIDSISPSNGRIVSLAQENSVYFTYNPIQNNTLNTFNPTDLVCTQVGKTVICDNGNDLLHVIDNNGLLEYYIDTKSCGIEKPWSLALLNEIKLYVGAFIYKGSKTNKDSQKGVVYVTDFNTNY